MTLRLTGEHDLGDFGASEPVALTMHLTNAGWRPVTVPVRIVFDDLSFESSTRDGVDHALVVGPPGMLPPGGREKTALGPGETMVIRIEDFCFRWQARAPGHYRFSLRVNLGGKLSEAHDVAFRLRGA